jgi:hypothetical protein
VLQTVSDDHNNALVQYAAKNSNVAKSSDTNLEAKTSKQQPSYVLGEKIVTTSTGENKRTLKCSGSMSVTVGDTKASKEVNFLPSNNRRTARYLFRSIHSNFEPFDRQLGIRAAVSNWLT